MDTIEQAWADTVGQIGEMVGLSQEVIDGLIAEGASTERLYAEVEKATNHETRPNYPDGAAPWITAKSRVFAHFKGKAPVGKKHMDANAADMCRTVCGLNGMTREFAEWCVDQDFTPLQVQAAISQAKRDGVGMDAKAKRSGSIIARAITKGGKAKPRTTTADVYAKWNNPPKAG